MKRHVYKITGGPNLLLGQPVYIYEYMISTMLAYVQLPTLFYKYK